MREGILRVYQETDDSIIFDGKFHKENGGMIFSQADQTPDNAGTWVLTVAAGECLQPRGALKITNTVSDAATKGVFGYLNKSRYPSRIYTKWVFKTLDEDFDYITFSTHRRSASVSRYGDVQLYSNYGGSEVVRYQDTSGTWKTISGLAWPAANLWHVLEAVFSETNLLSVTLNGVRVAVNDGTLIGSVGGNLVSMGYGFYTRAANSPKAFILDEFLMRELSS